MRRNGCRLVGLLYVVHEALCAQQGEATMGPLNPSRVSSVPALRKYFRWDGAVTQMGSPASYKTSTAELLDDGPTAEEWRRAFAAIAEQVVLRLAGYFDEKDFAKDGCRCVWVRFRSLDLEATHRGH